MAGIFRDCISYERQGTNDYQKIRNYNAIVKDFTINNFINILRRSKDTKILKFYYNNYFIVCVFLFYWRMAKYFEYILCEINNIFFYQNFYIQIPKQIFI